MIKSEILAPVSSFEMLESAVKSGAGAVYAGLTKYSARQSAKNFTLDELRLVIEYCRIRGVYVYLTLNVLLKDSEIKEAFMLAKEAYQLGVDGIIVQDLGFASLLGEAFPDLSLHASTQLSVHHTDGVKMLEKLGFSRVCLARELSFNEIKKIKENTNIELEVFVHGAHCMSVSGQCYFSAVIGQRSGNRGLCGQICRMPFKAGESENALSLKDLSVIQHLNELKELGIASFKIEGRMKRPEYVFAAVSACKAKLEHSEDFLEKYEKLKKVFSRSGFTDGYLSGNISKEMFGIRTKSDIAAEKLLKEIRNSQKEQPLVKINGRFLATENQITLAFSDGKNEVEVSAPPMETPKTRATDEKTIISAVKKLGGTPYGLDRLDLCILKSGFISLSRLNDMRREAVEKLNLKRARIPIRAEKEIDFTLKSHKIKDKTLVLIFDDFSQVPERIENVKVFLNADEKPESFKALLKKGIAAGVTLPRCRFHDERLNSKLLELRQMGVLWAYCNNIYAVELAKQYGFLAQTGFGMNNLNSFSVRTLERMDVTENMLSVEMKKNEINSIEAEHKVGIFAYGYLPLMLTRACPLHSLGCKKCEDFPYVTDRLGNQFRVLCKSEYREVLNMQPLDISGELFEYDVDFFVLSFTLEHKAEIQSIIDRFRRDEKQTDYQATRGLYHRGIL